ncbi:MAG: hypothetical protein AAF211_23150 [Myxococcota bacterium]
MNQPLHLVGLVVLGALAASSTPAWAQSCGGMCCDSYKKVSKTSHLVVGRSVWGTVGVCEVEPLAPAGSFTELPGCDLATPGGTAVEITGTAGDDQIAPLTRTITCNNVPMVAFDYPFGLFVEGLGGTDFLQGTESTDVLSSYDFGATIADGSIDWLCGYGGDDTLLGDYDASPLANESIDGGAGTDSCYGYTPGPIEDVSFECERVTTPPDLQMLPGSACNWRMGPFGSFVADDIIPWF